MKSPQRLLLLEDDPNDAELLRRHLSGEWPECEVIRVSAEASFRAALKAGGFDLILSDYRLPGFDGMAALALARKHYPDIPFIFVTGAIGDEVAVGSLKAGATDYVLKDRLPRLVPTIRRSLNEAEEFGRRKQIEQKLRDSEGEYRSLVNSVDGIVWAADLPRLRFTFVSEQAERLLGYPASCWLEEPDFWQRHIHAEDRPGAVAHCTHLSAEEKYQNFEYRMLAADGRVVWL